MVKTKRRNIYIVFVVIGVLAILGITLASAFRVSKSTDVNVYPVSLNANIDLIENLQNVVSGDTVVNEVSFSRATDSDDIYVRADLRYDATGTLSDADKRFLLAINYDDVATHEGDSYKWVRAEDGYYYLTDLSGAPLKVTNSDDYIFCSGLTYQGAKCINNDALAPATLKLNAELQAIHAKDMDSVTLTDLSTLFNTYFSAPASLGYIVTFDTDDAGFIKAQTFLNNGLTVTEPLEPTKLGYNFAGWYTDPEFNTLYNFDTTVTKSFTLYAKFTLPIRIIQDGQVIKEVQNENYTLSSLILAYKDLQNTYNFYNDQLLSDNITLDDVLADDHKMYVEPVTSGLKYSQISGVNEYMVGDGTTTNGNAMPSTMTDTDIVIADNYTANGTVYPVTEIGQYSFCNKSTLTSVEIPNTITSIGQNAFSGCSGLTGVYINDLNSWININFSNASSNPLQDAGNLYLNGVLVEELNIPSTITEIKPYVFYGCTSLTSVTIGNSVTSIGSSAFSGCSGLTGVYINDLNSWININFSSFYSNPLGNAGNLYLNGVLVEELNIPSTITEIKPYIFAGCTSLTNVSIPNSVTSIGDNAFQRCSGLTGALTIPDSVTSIGDDAFSYCSGLTGALTIPDSVTSIGDDAFSYCSGLTGDLTIPDSVESIGDWAFSRCSGLTGALTIGNSVTSIGDGAFSNCRGLTGDLTIPDSVTSIGDNAFSYCSGLTGALTIPDSVTSIGYSTFRDCSGLTGNLTIGNSVTSINIYAFSNCSGLTGNLTIGNSVTSIGSYAFSNCSGLTGNLTIGNSVTIIGDNAFQRCSGLTRVTIPASVTQIRLYAFQGCNNLNSVIFEITTGWYVSKRATGTSGTTLTLTNSRTNATYLKSTYFNYYWFRKLN